MLALPLSPLLLIGQFSLEIPIIEKTTTLLMIVFLISLTSFILYLVEIIKNKRIESSMRGVWIMIIFLMGSLGQIVYWFKYIMKGSEVSLSN